MKIDYNFKSKCLSMLEFNSYRKLRKIVFQYVYGNNVSQEEYVKALSSLHFYTKTFPKECKEFDRIINARCHRVRRLKLRLFNMLEKGKCLFLTLTYNDDYLFSTTEQERRRDVRDFLKSNSFEYIANMDFGKKNGREHYHAVVLCNNLNYSLWHRFGGIHGQRIIYKSDGFHIEKISKYIAKLTNHAIKETNKRQVIIYSR